MDMDIQHGHGHAARLRGHEAWTWTVDMHGCIDAGMLIKSSIRHRKFSVSLQRLDRHRHSGIMISLVPLVMD
jgi:hypothetical protein